LEKVFVRVSSPPIGKDHILYAKRFDSADFVYKPFKALMFGEHGILIIYVDTMCSVCWEMSSKWYHR